MQSREGKIQCFQAELLTQALCEAACDVLSPSCCLTAAQTQRNTSRCRSSLHTFPIYRPADRQPKTITVPVSPPSTWHNLLVLFTLRSADYRAAELALAQSHSFQNKRLLAQIKSMNNK